MLINNSNTLGKHFIKYIRMAYVFFLMNISTFYNCLFVVIHNSVVLFFCTCIYLQILFYDCLDIIIGTFE